MVEFQEVVSRVKMLDAGMEDDRNRVEEWRQWYELAVNALSQHAMQQHMILCSDCVRDFVAYEEALIATQGWN